MKEKQKLLKQAMRTFENSELNRSLLQLINTLGPLIILWFLAYKSVSTSIILSLVLSTIAAGFVIRTFIIFHDCTHYSFFKNNKLNRFFGTILGVVTLFPFAKWQREHSIHHATSGNIDKLGTGDIWVMTVEEYAQASSFKKLSYRIYRNPLVLFILGPFYLFLVTNRLNRKDAKLKERLNTYLTNLMIVLLYSALILLIGLKTFLIVQIPIIFIAGSLGIWLFYVQHQFEDAYFEDESEWNFVKAAIDGSSYYKLPKVLQWITGNIGYHHVHHLSPKVPNYHLEEAHQQTPYLHEATTITLGSSIKAIKFRLFDSENKRFVTFKEAKPLIKEFMLTYKAENKLQVTRN